MLDDFKAFVREQKVKVDEAAFAADEAFLRAMIHYDIDLALFGVSEARRNLVATAPQTRFALQLFSEAAQLAELRKAKPASSRGGMTGGFPNN